MLVLCCLLKVILCLCWGVRKGNNTSQFLCPWWWVSVCWSQGSTLKKTNNFPPCISGIFQIAIFMLSLGYLPAFSPGAMQSTPGSIPAKSVDFWNSKRKDRVCKGACADLLGEGLVTLRQREAWTRKAVMPEWKHVGLESSRLSSQYQVSWTSGGSEFMLGWGRGMATQWWI